MKHLFWILFALETSFLLWMLWDEIKLKYLPVPAYIPLGILWMLLAVIVKVLFKSDQMALVMVGIPGVPLLFMLGFMIKVFVVNLVGGPIRWN
jgi:hypothetical protein